MYKYSFIVASRNDNHGGNMRAKNIFFINRWLHSIKKYNLNCELIIVDWNSKIMEPHNQINLWKTELGLDCKKTPEELRKILGWVPQPKKSIKFFVTRSVDLISGSSKTISLKVLKSTVSK